MKNIESVFADFISSLKEKKNSDFEEYFCNPHDRFEFELDAFRDFIQKRELIPGEVEFIDNDQNVAKFKYKYRNEGEPEERHDRTTWLIMKKVGENWKIASKGEYLRSLADSKQWRKIETPNCTFYFDSFLKKTLDQINTECGASEFDRIKKHMDLDAEFKISYFVYEDEKSLEELGFKSNMSGQDWMLSNQPCDVFQLVSLCLKRINPELPKYFLYGFSAYYSHFMSTSKFPLFDFPTDDFDRIVLSTINYGYYIKIVKLLKNAEFNKWTEMVTVMSLLSQQKTHPNLMIFLITASFVKFLFENESLGGNRELRSKRFFEIYKKCNEENIEKVFREITGLKIKKAEKLWKKDLKVKCKNTD